MSQIASEDELQGLSTLSVGLGLSVTLVLEYVACWAVAATPIGPAFAHAWLGVFTAEPAGTIR